jgi:hypothetical protein
MKNLSLALILLVIQPYAFAASCIPADKEIVSVNAEYFDAHEQELIYSTMKLDTWRAMKDIYDAVWQFEDRDYCERERSPDAGEIVYFSSQGRALTLVRHFRGGNEYGAYFENQKMIATIDMNKVKCL